MNPATAKQPTPHGKGVDVAAYLRCKLAGTGNAAAIQLCDDIEARVTKGAKEYGERLTSYNGRDALVDAYQEALDLLLYLTQLELELGKTPYDYGAVMGIVLFLKRQLIWREKGINV